MSNDNVNSADGSHKPSKPLPSTVGNSFVKQYYHLLGQNPETLHRFYKDESQYTHGTGSQKEMPVSGQKNINDKILSMGFGGARVDLECGSVDCQPSSQDGVIVMVSGMISLPHTEARPFVQTFFLAVQPNGYFVLNDAFRYLDTLQARVAAVQAPAPAPVVVEPAVQPPPAPVPVVSPKRTVAHPPKTASPRKEARPAPEPEKHDVPEQSPEVVHQPAPPQPEQKEKSAKHTKEPVMEKAPVEKAAPAPAKAEAAKPAAPMADKPAQKKNWASFLFPESGPASSSSSAPAPRKQAQSQSSRPAPSNTPAVEDSAPVSEPVKETPSSSLYVGDIAPTTKESDLREMFKSYGAIANVSVHASRGFAFIDYEEPEGVTNALAGGRTFTLGDRNLHVEARHADKKSGDNAGGGRGGRGGRGPRPRGDRSSNRPDKASRDKEVGDRRDKGGRRGGRADFPGRSRGPRVD